MNRSQDRKYFEEREADARRFLEEFEKRLGRFELELHPENAADRVWGKGMAQPKAAGPHQTTKPPTFTFLGLTHVCGANRWGRFQVWRETAGKRMRAKLQQIKLQLRAGMHRPVAVTGQWLRGVVAGYFRYQAVPGNARQLGRFRWRLRRLWRKTPLRRSQTAKLTWEKYGLLFERWIPTVRTLHPYPSVRFDARIRAGSRMR